MGNKKKYYAVREGRERGVYDAWFGSGGAEEKIRGYAGARYKGFPSKEEAEAWLRGAVNSGANRPHEKKQGQPFETGDTAFDGITIYTDGSCRGNPGPGGYGAVILDGDKRRELARGFRLTTNNRMELLACIVALEALKEPSKVMLYSDSSYVVNGISKGWAKKWRANNWMRNRTDPAVNADLWEALLNQCERHQVRFVWVRGHAGNIENERCDELALEAASNDDLTIDGGYEEDSDGKAGTSTTTGTNRN